MPSVRHHSRGWRRIVRLAGSSCSARSSYWRRCVGPHWFEVLVPPSVQFHAGIALLRAARSVYIARPGELPAAIVLLAVARSSPGAAGRGRRCGSRLAALRGAGVRAWPSPRGSRRPGWPRCGCRSPGSGPSSPTRPATAPSTSSCSASRAPRACPIRTGSRSARSSPGSSARPCPHRRFPRRRPGQARAQAGRGALLLATARAPAGPGDPLRRAQRVLDAIRLGARRAALRRRDAPGAVTLARPRSARTPPVCRVIDETIGAAAAARPADADRDAPAGGRPGVHRGRIRRAAPRFPRPAGGDHGVLRAGRGAGRAGDPAGQRRRFRAEPLVPAGGDAAGRARGVRPGVRGRPPARGGRPRRAPSRPIAACSIASPGSPRRTTGWPGCWRRPAVATRRTAITSRPATATACPMRCPSDFQDVYREVAARHPGRSWSTARRCSAASARAAGWATPSSPTASTRRSSATRHWPRRSSGDCTLAGPSAGARPPRRRNPP